MPFTYGIWELSCVGLHGADGSIDPFHQAVCLIRCTLCESPGILRHHGPQGHAALVLASASVALVPLHISAVHALVQHHREHSPCFPSRQSIKFTPWCQRQHAPLFFRKLTTCNVFIILSVHLCNVRESIPHVCLQGSQRNPPHGVSSSVWRFVWQVRAQCL